MLPLLVILAVPPSHNQPELSSDPSVETQQVPESFPVHDSNFCQHRFSNRTRCRKLVSHANLRFCPRHAVLPENMQLADLTPELISDPKDLDRLDGIYDFLSRLIILQAQNRISNRRAAVLAYITNQLLRTFAAIKRVEADQANEASQTIFDVPRHQDAQPEQSLCMSKNHYMCNKCYCPGTRQKTDAPYQKPSS